MATLSADSINEIKQLAAEATKDPVSQIPGVSIAIVNKNGDVLLEHAAGKRGVNSDENMTTENTFWIASCTKISATIIALQAVEQGIVGLDSADDVEKFCPELKTIPIIKEVKEDGSMTFVPKKNRITLRMLLSHTSGLGYSFFDERLGQFASMFGIDELNLGPPGCEKSPLTFEPGTRWQYGVGIDWAINVVTRATGKTFQQLLKERIFDPLEMTRVSTQPCKAIKSQLAHLSLRDPKTNKLSQIDHPTIYPLSDDPAVAALTYESGGAGIFAKPSEYVRIFAALLNGGTYAPNGAKILSSKTVAEMFVNQIPQWPDFGRQGIVTTREHYSRPLPDIFPQPGNPPQGWGLSFFLTETPTPWGRSANTAFWCGIANLYYWIDVKNGVAGFVCTQIFPFADPHALKLWIETEAAVYKGLSQN